MKQYAEHDKVGLCHALRKDEMYVRTFSGGYPYLKNGILVRSSSVAPIYSYGKNYEKNDKKFAMFVWTTNSDSTEVEKTFKSLLKNIGDEKIDQVLDDGSFIYVD
jgi:hypothetical protein